MRMMTKVGMVGLEEAAREGGKGGSSSNSSNSSSSSHKATQRQVQGEHEVLVRVCGGSGVG